jgi:hypothetical protein
MSLVWTAILVDTERWWESWEKGVLALCAIMIPQSELTRLSQTRL